MKPGSFLRGRGPNLAPPNRFASEWVELDPEDGAGEEDPPRTVRTWWGIDHASTILTRNDSPDIPFTWSLNPYRGCEHGCAYCYARPTHEYLGFNAGLDFETRILVKDRAADLLRAALARPSWVPDPLVMSGVTDCYQPVERRLRITRSCLEVLAECRHPVGVVTKNALITRDLDLLAPLAGWGACRVGVSLTTLDPGLARRLEPRAAGPALRLETIRKLSGAGIPVVAMLAPVIPAVNDHEIPRLLQAAADAGARHAAFILLRLPHAVKDVFSGWLDMHLPERREKVLSQLRSFHGGDLYRAAFATRRTGTGPAAERLRALFRVWAGRTGLDRPLEPLSTAAFRRPSGPQLELGL